MRRVLVLVAAAAALVAVFVLLERSDPLVPDLPRPEASGDPAALAPPPSEVPSVAEKATPTGRVVAARRGRLAVAGHLVRAVPGGSAESGRPAANVPIELELFLEGAGKPFEGELTTDGEGRFALDLENAEERAGSIRVRVRGEGFQPARPSFFFEAGTTELAPVVVQYALADLAGLVVDPEGRPVEGVMFRIVDAGVPREATTDANGRFRVPRVWSPLEPDAVKEGWLALAIPTFRKDDVGRWQDVEILVGPTATLRVLLSDGGGDGIPGRWVRGEISPVDPYGTKDSGWAPFSPKSAQVESDAEGEATLTGLPADRRLRIRIDGREFEYLDPFGWLREGASNGATPLVLAPGAVRHVGVRYGRTVVVRGRVLEPDGTPSPRADVSVSALDVLDRGRPDSIGVVKTGEDGTFELRAVPRATTRRVFLLARGTIGELVSRSMFGGTAPPDPLHACWQTLELPESGEPPGELVLPLGVMEKIAGRVIGPGEEGLTADLRLLPHVPSPLRDRLPSGAPLRTRAAVTGEFEFAGVPPGLYDIEVRTEEHATTVVRGVAAGEREVEVHVSGEPQATVTVEVESAAELKQVILLRARLEPLDDELTAPTLGENVTVDEPLGWPRHALGLWYGAQTWTGDLGRTMFGSSPIEGRTKTYRLSPGLYWFGAKAATPTGQCFPIGTGLVRVGKGEYAVRFALEEAGSIEGRVTAEESILGLCTGVAVPGGALIPLDVGRDAMAPWAELDADGGFRLGIVPARSLELRVGTARELESGDARTTRSLVVEPGATARIELDL